MYIFLDMKLTMSIANVCDNAHFNSFDVAQT